MRNERKRYTLDSISAHTPAIQNPHALLVRHTYRERDTRATLQFIVASVANTEDDATSVSLCRMAGRERSLRIEGHSPNDLRYNI